MSEGGAPQTRFDGTEDCVGEAPDGAGSPGLRIGAMATISGAVGGAAADGDGGATGALGACGRCAGMDGAAGRDAGADETDGAAAI